jgi:hypothetical protein
VTAAGQDGSPFLFGTWKSAGKRRLGPCSRPASCCAQYHQAEVSDELVTLTLSTFSIRQGLHPPTQFTTGRARSFLSRLSGGAGISHRGFRAPNRRLAVQKYRWRRRSGRYPSKAGKRIEGGRSRRHQRRGYGEGCNVAGGPSRSRPPAETGDGSRVGPRKTQTAYRGPTARAGGL